MSKPPSESMVSQSTGRTRLYVRRIGKDRVTFLDEEQQHVFIEQKGKGKLVMTYVQYAYAKLTKGKNKDDRTLTVIREDYDQGILRVPCVRLECREYNGKLFKELTSNAPSPLSVGPSTPSSTTLNRRPKRQRRSNSRKNLFNDDGMFSSDDEVQDESDSNDLSDFSSDLKANGNKTKRPRLDYGPEKDTMSAKICGSTAQPPAPSNHD
ncbi:hypothetical protein L218DRAFT_992961 [Marasmius fiardii PR-910]|nr:hypothetical protein L218DRAFT_992961 [Marasmius fiardii PR-910]